MKIEKLNQLLARAKRAKELSDRIEELENADPNQSGVKARLWHADTNSDLLPYDLLKNVISHGRQIMIKSLTEELSHLVGDEPLPVKVE